MTSTTVKQRPPSARRLPRLAPVAAALLLAPPCHAGWRFTPAAGLAETYTDNVNLQGPESARSQFVTEATAGFSLAGNSRRLKVAASSQWQAFTYRDSELPNVSHRERGYRANAEGILAEDLLYFDAAASGGAQSVSAFGPRPQSNLYALDNRADIRTWRVSPYLKHRFGSSAQLSLRYTRDAVDTGGARNLSGNSDGSTVTLDLASGPGSRTLGWGLSYRRQDLDTPQTGTSLSQTALGSLSYRLAPHLALTASTGYDRYDYQALNGRSAGRNWSGGFIWTPSQRTRLQASLGRHYVGQTGSLTANHRSRRSVWNINYSDTVTTSRSQFLLPATIDTASMLDRLFMTRIPDPAARQQAVQDYMAETGLPASLAESVNYLTNRYLRQQALRASSAFNWAHSTAVMSLFHTRRTALSSPEGDGALPGGQPASLNDNVVQSGASVQYNYRFSSRSGALVALNAGRTRSLSTGIEDTPRALRIALTRKFGSKLGATVEVRRASGSTGAGTGRTYRENAVSASLAMQL